MDWREGECTGRYICNIIRHKTACLESRGAQYILVLYSRVGEVTSSTQMSMVPAQSTVDTRHFQLTMFIHAIGNFWG